MNRELTELVDFARANSPFYKGLYDGLTGPYRITDLPIIDQPAFWAANTVHGNRVLTGPQRDGIVFKTGGTTSAPRVSVYTREEWREMAATFATGLTAAGVRPGDRVANLYHAGELYSGFVFTLNVLQQALVDTVQLPVAGNAPLEFTVQTLRDFDATVLAGFPTYLVGLAKFVRDTVGSLPGVRLILFSGEAFYGDQRACVEAAFPTLRSGPSATRASTAAFSARRWRTIPTCGCSARSSPAACWRSSTPSTRRRSRSRGAPVACC